MLLSQTAAGTPARVRQVHAGRALCRRLAELGIYPGAMMTVLKNDHGPLVLEVLGARMAIGRGQAEKIEVEAQ